VTRIIPLDHFRAQPVAASRRVAMDATPAPLASPQSTAISGATMQSRILASGAARPAMHSAQYLAPTIHLQSFYPIYQAYGSRTIGVGAKGVSFAAETVQLMGQSPYTIATSFGLSDPRGQMKIDILDPAHVAVRSLISDPGKTRAILSIVPVDGGLFTIRLAGQKFEEAEESVRIYGSYQIVVTQAAAEDSKSPTATADGSSLNLTW
jgi:hypothetical protein